METIREDLIFSWKRLWQRPLATIVVIVTFGLTIATAATVLSLVDAALLRPLPLRSADELVWIWNARTDRDKAFFSVADWMDFRDRQRSLSGFAALTNWGANLTGRSEPQRVQGVRATANLFEVLGARAAIGRLIQSGDGAAGSARVVVVTWSFWRRTLGADASALGNALVLGGEPYVLIGVLPPEFPTRLPGTDADAEVFTAWIPETDARVADRDDNFLRGLGRMKNGRTLAEVRSDLARVQAQLRAEYPGTNGKKVAPRALPLREEIIGDLRPLLLLLTGAVALMGLLACLNIACVQMAEGLTRQREFAMRTTLGATRRRLIQQLLTESTVSAGVGGIAGLTLAPFVLEGCLLLAPPGAIPAGTIHLSATALLIATGVTLLAGVFFGALQSRRALSLELEPALREGGKGSTASAQHSRTLQAIVAGEIALAFLFLLGAGLFAASLYNAARIDPGFEPRSVLTARLSVQADRYPDVATFMRFLDALTSGLRAVPGVESVAFTNVLPLSGMNARRDFSIVGRPPLTNADTPGAQVRYVSEEYFKALRVRILRGSDFPEHARLDTRRIAIVDQALATRFLGERSPIGAQLDTDGIQWEVVGVVADVKYDKLDDPATPTLYLPLGQMPADNVGFMANRFSLVMRTASDPATFAKSLQRVLRTVAPDVPASAVKPLPEWISDSLAPRRLLVVLIALFGIASLGLAILGVYGLLAQVVSQRTQEFGIRMAVGAQPREIFLSTLREGMRLAAIGLVGGLVAAWAFGRVTRHFLFGIGAADPRMVAATLIIVFLVAVFASALPARRASRLSPLVAMRSGEG